MKLFISPHNDDETLFGAFTLMREKPLVVIVTDSYIQPNRGDKGCSARERREETSKAMKLLGCPVFFAGLRDDVVTSGDVVSLLASFEGFETVYAPAVQGGNIHHDMIGNVALQVFNNNLIQYTTYTKTELHTKGTIELVPTFEERELKNKALWSYQSQINLASTRPHFEAAIGESEWLIK